MWHCHVPCFSVKLTVYSFYVLDESVLSCCCCEWNYGLSQKMIQANVAVLSATALSVTSVMSVANDKDDNGLILGAVHRSPGIYLTAKENLDKPQLKDS